MNSNKGCLNAGFKLAVFGIIIISICLVLFSCSTYKCYPSKKSRDYSIEQADGNSKNQKLPRSV